MQKLGINRAGPRGCDVARKATRLCHVDARSSLRILPLARSPSLYFPKSYSSSPLRSLCSSLIVFSFFFVFVLSFQYLISLSPLFRVFSLNLYPPRNFPSSLFYSSSNEFASSLLPVLPSLTLLTFPILMHLSLSLVFVVFTAPL